jgi:transcriptional regulator with XRE-family HTH domain
MLLTDSALYFRHELIELRMAFGLTRQFCAWMLGISASTLRRWEEGPNVPQPASIVRALSRIENLQREPAGFNEAARRLKAVLEDYAQVLKISRFEGSDQKVLRLEKDLSSTILRAAQSDFQYEKSRNTIISVPFVSDLGLFKESALIDIRNLLNSLARQAREILPDLQSANINSTKLAKYFEYYADECQLEIPNPRYLQSRGETIRSSIENPEITLAIGEWDRVGIQGFIDDHNELMRRYFGEALVAAVAVNDTAILDQVADEAPQLIADAISALNSVNAAGKGQFDSKITAILFDLRMEILSFIDQEGRANRPEIALRLRQRALNAVKHSAIFIGRLLYRTLGFVITNGGNISGLAVLLESQAPGSIRVVYDSFVAAIQALPKLPF